MLAGLAIEAMVGWPDAVDRRIGHPVRWFGWLVERTERLGNRQSWSRSARIATGGLVTLFLVVLAGLIGLAIQLFLPAGWLGLALMALVVSSMIAARSLHDHVADHTVEDGAVEVAILDVLSKVLGRNRRFLCVQLQGDFAVSCCQQHFH